jgi:ribosomal protein S18 acetylase RimI-like enzyme
MPVTTPLDVEITDINNNNIEQLKLINITTLPVRYTDKFYKDLLEKGSKEYLKYAAWNGFQVGATCARVETHDTVPDCNRLYIMTINVLAAYRRRGVGEDLLAIFSFFKCRLIYLTRTTPAAPYSLMPLVRFEAVESPS